MQGGLVDNGAVEGGRAVAFVGEGYTLEPIGPPLIEMSLDFDLVDCGGSFFLFFSHISTQLW